MARVHVFADEAGYFDFSRTSGASHYFVLTTVTFLDDYSSGHDLQELRLQLAWEGVELDREFHATTDPQAVRDRVYAALAPHDFRVDATILEKPKATPRIRRTDERFYQTAWFFHMRHVAPRIVQPGDDLLLVAASVGTRRKRAAFYGGVQDVMQQVSPATQTRTAYWPASVHPCLQVADYCAWAIQRKWESGDSRSYALVQDKIKSEYDLFSAGMTVYY